MMRGKKLGTILVRISYKTQLMRQRCFVQTASRITQAHGNRTPCCMGRTPTRNISWKTQVTSFDMEDRETIWNGSASPCGSKRQIKILVIRNMGGNLDKGGNFELGGLHKGKERGQQPTILQDEEEVLCWITTE
ncbi:hypothetical protein BTVI_82438 [Pitangus sulphuratus]|nr:hypothetical protein BTVI_82438 [Pitangus sulphuratus]